MPVVGSAGSGGAIRERGGGLCAREFSGPTDPPWLRAADARRTPPIHVETPIASNSARPRRPKTLPPAALVAADAPPMVALAAPPAAMVAADAALPHREEDGGVWDVFWCYPGWWDLADRLEELLPAWARLVRVDASRPLAEQVGGAHVLIPTTGAVDAAAIAAAKDLRLIAQPAAGFDCIDVAAAAAAGIPVTLAPGCNAEAVAECALMLMLMLSRRYAEAAAAFAAGAPVGRPIGRELRGRTLAIVGLGRTGRATAAAAAALGMAVLPGATTSASSRAELHALLAQADVVSLHCPLTEATRGLIGAAEFAAMRPGALLINCARGAVVDRDALLAALEAGSLGGAGLDVHWLEPADASEPLYRHPHVVSTPHLGSATTEVYDRFARVLLANIVAMRAGRPQDLLHRLC